MIKTALTLAGLDPSGGAGIAADLRAFSAARVWGAAVCAALTVQSTRGVRAVYPVPASRLLAQARELFGDLDIRAMKSGALGSASGVRAVRSLAREHPEVPLVVDPVMLPSRTRGSAARLDGAAGGPRALLELARSAALVTPNRPEAAALLGRPVRSESDARAAALALVAAGCRAALVKGGHGRGAEAVDWLATASGVVRIARPRVSGGPIHGTGCTLASLIAGRLAARSLGGAASDDDLLAAVLWAREQLDHAIRGAVEVGKGQRVLSFGPIGKARDVARVPA